MKNIFEEINQVFEDAALSNEKRTAADAGADKMADLREWHRRRLGNWTASSIKKLMTKGRGKGDDWGDTAMAEVYRVAAERNLTPDGIELYIDELMSRDFKQTRWGNENEAAALERFGGNVRPAYELVRIKHATIPRFTATPDGAVDNQIIVEVKCPYTVGNHLKPGYIDEYIPQIQAQLAVTGAQGCIVVKYDPRVKAPLDLITQRIDRDEEYIAAIERRILEAEALITQITSKL